MTIQANLVSEDAIASFHPDLQAAVRAVKYARSAGDALKVTFRKREEKINSRALPVMWRRGEDISSVAYCGAECGVCC